MLVLDEDGAEVLRGLTVAETQFMLNYDMPTRQAHDAEALLFDQLRSKFVIAREIALMSAAVSTALQLERYRATRSM